MSDLLSFFFLVSSTYQHKDCDKCAYKSTKYICLYKIEVLICVAEFEIYLLRKLTNISIPINSGVSVLNRYVLLICIAIVIMYTPVIWHIDTNLLVNFAIAISVTQNARMLEKKSLCCNV